MQKQHEKPKFVTNQFQYKKFGHDELHVEPLFYGEKNTTIYMYFVEYVPQEKSEKTIRKSGSTMTSKKRQEN